MPTPRRYASQAERQAAYRRRQAEVRRKEQEAKGLPALPAVASIPGHARWQALLGQAELLLRTVQEEMQEYYDGRSESWQEAERGEVFRERLQAVQEAQATIEDLSR
jgi:hypothetical protein